MEGLTRFMIVVACSVLLSCIISHASPIEGKKEERIPKKSATVVKTALPVLLGGGENHSDKTPEKVPTKSATSVKTAGPALFVGENRTTPHSGKKAEKVTKKSATVVKSALPVLLVGGENHSGDYHFGAIAGTITSPNYPAKYPNNLNMVWNIGGLTGDRIHMVFEAFSTEGVPNDWVEIRDLNSGGTLLAKYSGIYSTNPPPPVTSTSNKVWIRFRTDGSYTYTGFKMNYYLIRNPTDELPIPLVSHCMRHPSGVCFAVDLCDVGDMIADAKNCTQFKRCNQEATWVTDSCPTGFTFDYKTCFCYLPTKAVCFTEDYICPVQT